MGLHELTHEHGAENGADGAENGLVALEILQTHFLNYSSVGIKKNEKSNRVERVGV
jgi:hypothetical protein